MKQLCTYICIALAAAAQTLCADGTLPLRNAKLQTDLDGGGQSVTNVVDLTASGTIEAAAITIGGVNLTGIYQPLDATLTSIAGGVIGEDLDNTAYPWSDSEVSDTLTIGPLATVDDAAIPAGITRDTEWNTIAKIETATGVSIQQEPAEGPFINGDKTKLDGAMQDLADDATPTLGGDVDAAGYDLLDVGTVNADLGKVSENYVELTRNRYNSMVIDADRPTRAIPVGEVRVAETLGDTLYLSLTNALSHYTDDYWEEGKVLRLDGSTPADVDGWYVVTNLASCTTADDPITGAVVGDAIIAATRETVTNTTITVASNVVGGATLAGYYLPSYDSISSRVFATYLGGGIGRAYDLLISAVSGSSGISTLAIDSRVEGNCGIYLTATDDISSTQAWLIFYNLSTGYTLYYGDSSAKIDTFWRQAAGGGVLIGTPLDYEKISVR